MKAPIRFLWCRRRHTWSGTSRPYCWACADAYDIPDERGCCCGTHRCDGRGPWPANGDNHA